MVSPCGDDFELSAPADTAISHFSFLTSNYFKLPIEISVDVWYNKAVCNCKCRVKGNEYHEKEKSCL